MPPRRFFAPLPAGIVRGEFVRLGMPSCYLVNHPGAVV
jgi:hypothetical protein